ncbi:Hypothetical predicted protein [Podarcis lilfordi]|uniref:Uncharacterized protein n=1 Tax=Podarcis lilfordi TaxID=74358 RepID=A0AA35L8B9_9SAUR|nr:Hypothetical predicted protein [Podarcis lilfordi]
MRFAAVRYRSLKRRKIRMRFGKNGGVAVSRAWTDAEALRKQYARAQYSSLVVSRARLYSVNKSMRMLLKPRRAHAQRDACVFRLP